MEPKRTLHSGNLVRGDRKLFMELGTCFTQQEGYRNFNQKKRNVL